MKSRIYLIAAIAACTFTCGLARAQADYSTWGVKVGLFMPSNSTIRQIFGDNWFSFGLTPQQQAAGKDLTFGEDVGFITASSNGNRLLLVPVTAGFTKLFEPRQNAVVPYGAVRAGAAYYDYSITKPLGASYTNTSVNLTGNVELGVIFSQKFVLAARYDWFAQSNGFTFDGFTVWAEMQLFKF